MKTIKLAFAVAVVAAATPALAQESGGSPIRAGAELAVVIPTGDWADFSGIGFGPMGRASYKMAPQVSLVGRVGYIFHLSKDQGGGFETSTSELLFMGGAQFHIVPDLTIGAQTGFASLGSKISFDGQSTSDSVTRIPLALEANYAMANGVMVGGGLIIPNLLLTEDGEDMQIGIMANVGYNFLR